MYTCNTCYEQEATPNAMWIQYEPGMLVCNECQMRAYIEGTSHTALAGGQYAAGPDPRVPLADRAEIDGNVLLAIGNMEAMVNRAVGVVSILIDGKSVAVCNVPQFHELHTLCTQISAELETTAPGERSALLSFAEPAAGH